MKKSAIVFLLFSFLLTSCGAKKNVATKSEKIAVQDQGVIIATDAEIEKPTLGLFWQNDQLQITLNQGRQLDFYRAETDTLYLYETPRDTTDYSTRRYTLNIPSRELLIIKYNDSLVYPLMPTEAICEYPLDIKSMGVKNIEKYNAAIKRLKESGDWTGYYIVDNEPLEFRAGTYIYNAGLYRFGSDCECKIDSTKELMFYTDGIWLQYEKKALRNCGIMRKNSVRRVYEAFSNKGKIVYFLDTTSIVFLTRDERKRRKLEQIPWDPNEYSSIGPANIAIFSVFPCKEDSMMRYLFDGYSSLVHNGPVLMYEGSTCGWKKNNNNN